MITFELLSYIPWNLMVLMTISEVEALRKHNGRRRQLGSFTRWAFLGFSNVGQDNPS